jgi:hypothetical protein
MKITDVNAALSNVWAYFSPKAGQDRCFIDVKEVGGLIVF